MANEYLQRTPTSSGNSRRWTVSFWMKNSDPAQGYTAIMGAGKVSPTNVYNELFYTGSQIGFDIDNSSDPESYFITAAPLLRDPSAWMHVVLSFTDQGDNANTRVKFYINGAFVDNNTTTALDIDETTFWNNVDYIQYIGSRAQQDAGSNTFNAQYTDIFLIDGQALTPDVFGFYKEGDGYVSAGSTMSTDFRPGQWVPKRPRIIKTEIERRGGFGVNGFYLPMNDSSNAGADFHCTPNSIITLKGEDLPQPRNGAPTTSDAFVSQLRQEAGTLGFDGVVKFDGSGDYLSIPSSNDFNLDNTWTIEYFFYNKSTSVSRLHFFHNDKNNIQTATNGTQLLFYNGSTATTFGGISLHKWYHLAVVNSSGTVTFYIDGKSVGTASAGSVSAATALTIGAYSDGQNPFDGFISNFRVVNGTALYTSNFTAPTEPLTNVTNTKLLCCNSSSSATASTVTPGTITANGDVFATRNELTGSVVLAVPGISTATGSNRVSNGNFDSNISDWTTVQATTSWQSGVLRIVPNVSVNGGVYQSITTEVGKRYTVSVEVVAAGATFARVYAGTSTDINSVDKYAYTGNATIYNVGAGKYTASFTPTTTTTIIWLEVGGGAQTQVDFDNIVVKQEDAPRDYSADIKGSGSNKTLTPNGSAGVGYEIPSYYGSAMNFDGNGDSLQGPLNSSDLEMGSDDFTVEAWANPSDVSGPGAIAGIWDGNSNDRSWMLYHGTGGNLNFIISGDGSTNSVVGSGITMTTGQWYHVVGEKEGTTIRIIVNGVVAGINTAASTSVYNSAEEFRIGVYDFSDATPNEFTGYIQDVRVYKGLAKYKGGFDVPKPYTPVGIESWRQVSDVTANNFATMNPLIEARPTAGTSSPLNSTIVTFADGNLNLSNSSSAGNAQRMVSFATVGIATGKWYYEEIASSNSEVGLSKGFQQRSYDTLLGDGSGLEATVVYRASGTVGFANTAYYSTATTLSPPSFDNTNIIGVSIDASLGENNLTVEFYKDGVGVSTLTGVGATSSVREWFPTKGTSSSGAGDQRYFNFGQNPSFSGLVTPGTNTDSNGKGLFKYAPPSGFLALCEDNLPAPTISNPGEHFKSVLWTGDGNEGRSITGVGFKPDFVWIKERTSPTTVSSHRLFDTIRGPGNVLLSDNDSIELPRPDEVRSFDKDGFSLGSSPAPNEDGSTVVAWCWKAGGPAVANNDGSIASQVSVNQDAGFSIATFTTTLSGSGTETFGHGLGKAPSMVIVKGRDITSSWGVYHKGIGPTGLVYLDLDNSTSTSTFHWGDTAPTDSVVTLGYGSATGSAADRVAYCWAEVEGFSKFGSYIGNGDADGPFVYCGFKPAFLLYKNTTTASQNWIMLDSSRTSTNPVGNYLLPHTADPEGSVDLVDFVSNGFKLRINSTAHNGSGENIIFAAFAESPFKYANSK